MTNSFQEGHDVDIGSQPDNDKNIQAKLDETLKALNKAQEQLEVSQRRSALLAKKNKSLKDDIEKLTIKNSTYVDELSSEKKRVQTLRSAATEAQKKTIVSNGIISDHERRIQELQKALVDKEVSLQRQILSLQETATQEKTLLQKEINGIKDMSQSHEIASRIKEVQILDLEQSVREKKAQLDKHLAELTTVRQQRDNLVSGSDMALRELYAARHRLEEQEKHVGQLTQQLLVERQDHEQELEAIKAKAKKVLGAVLPLAAEKPIVVTSQVTADDGIVQERVDDQTTRGLGDGVGAQAIATSSELPNAMNVGRVPNGNGTPAAPGVALLSAADANSHDLAMDIISRFLDDRIAEDEALSQLETLNFRLRLPAAGPDGDIAYRSGAPPSVPEISDSAVAYVSSAAAASAAAWEAVFTEQETETVVLPTNATEPKPTLATATVAAEALTPVPMLRSNRYDGVNDVDNEETAAAAEKLPIDGDAFGNDAPTPPRPLPSLSALRAVTATDEGTERDGKPSASTEEVPRLKVPLEDAVVDPSEASAEVSGSASDVEADAAAAAAAVAAKETQDKSASATPSFKRPGVIIVPSPDASTVGPVTGRSLEAPPVPSSSWSSYPAPGASSAAAASAAATASASTPLLFQTQFVFSDPEKLRRLLIRARSSSRVNGALLAQGFPLLSPSTPSSAHPSPTSLGPNIEITRAHVVSTTASEPTEPSPRSPLDLDLSLPSPASSCSSATSSASPLCSPSAFPSTATSHCEGVTLSSFSPVSAASSALSSPTSMSGGAGAGSRTLLTSRSTSSKGTGSSTSISSFAQKILEKACRVFSIEDSKSSSSKEKAKRRAGGLPLSPPAAAATVPNVVRLSSEQLARVQAVASDSAATPSDVVSPNLSRRSLSRQSLSRKGMYAPSSQGAGGVLESIAAATAAAAASAARSAPAAASGLPRSQAGCLETSSTTTEVAAPPSKDFSGSGSGSWAADASVGPLDLVRGFGRL